MKKHKERMGTRYIEIFTSTKSALIQASELTGPGGRLGREATGGLACAALAASSHQFMGERSRQKATARGAQPLPNRRRPSSTTAWCWGWPSASGGCSRRACRRAPAPPRCWSRRAAAWALARPCRWRTWWRRRGSASRTSPTPSQVREALAAPMLQRVAALGATGAAACGALRGVRGGRAEGLCRHLPSCLARRGGHAGAVHLWAAVPGPPCVTLSTHALLPHRPRRHDPWPGLAPARPGAAHPAALWRRGRAAGPAAAAGRRRNHHLQRARPTRRHAGKP